VIGSEGTGLTGRNGTPSSAVLLLGKRMEGFGELFRVLSFETIGASSRQSRCRPHWMRSRPPGTD
jgi:molybdenum cofactor biosynthesis protein B